jgi:hypothetical protein
MKQSTFKVVFIVFPSLIALAMFQGCQQSAANKSSSTANIDTLKKIATDFAASNEMLAKNLKTFDDLDFDVFTNQKWDRLKESHAQDIKVYWPDGHMTQGIDTHIEDLKKLFVYAPDTRIKEHPIKFGSGKYTLATGVIEGTFSKPMPIGNGKFIPPTGKAFKMPMATVGIWENGVMTEEHLFWDNKTYLKQIGLQ